MKKMLIVGYGNMGKVIASAERSKFEVWVYDTDQSKMSDAKEDEFSIFINEENKQKFDFILLALPGPLEQKISLDITISKLKKGGIVIDLTTSEVETVKMLDGALKELGFEYVELPVLGGPPSIGKWILIMGGEKEKLEIISAVFSGIGKVFYSGGIGQATIFKLLNNMMTASNAVIVGEVFSLAQQLRINLSDFYEVVNSSESAGKNEVFKVRFPKLLNNDLKDTFTIELMEKDAYLALVLAKSVKAYTPLTALSHQIALEAMKRNLGKKDIGNMYKLYNEETND